MEIKSGRIKIPVRRNQPIFFNIVVPANRVYGTVFILLRDLSPHVSVLHGSGTRMVSTLKKLHRKIETGRRVFFSHSLVGSEWLRISIPTVHRENDFSLVVYAPPTTKHSKKRRLFVLRRREFGVKVTSCPLRQLHPWLLFLFSSSSSSSSSFSRVRTI